MKKDGNVVHISPSPGSDIRTTSADVVKAIADTVIRRLLVDEYRITADCPFNVIAPHEIYSLCLGVTEVLAGESTLAIMPAPCKVFTICLCHCLVRTVSIFLH